MHGEEESPIEITLKDLDKFGIELSTEPNLKRLTRLQAQQRDLLNQTDQLQARRSAVEKQMDDEVAQYRKKQDELEKTIEDESASLQAQLDELKKQVDEREAKKDALRKEYQTQKEALEKQLQALKDAHDKQLLEVEEEQGELKKHVDEQNARKEAVFTRAGSEKIALQKALQDKKDELALETDGVEKQQRNIFSKLQEVQTKLAREVELLNRKNESELEESRESFGNGERESRAVDGREGSTKLNPEAKQETKTNVSGGETSLLDGLSKDIYSDMRCVVLSLDEAVDNLFQDNEDQAENQKTSSSTKKKGVGAQQLSFSWKDFKKAAGLKFSNSKQTV